MSSVSSLDACLEPIAGDNPAGQALRQDSAIDALYFQLKDKRNAARDIERREAMGDNSDNRADWQGLATLCIKTLAENSKDIEIATWLIEALLRLEGFSGLTKGINLLKGLIQRYADSLYPLEDEDGTESRLASIISLNGDDYDGTLISPIAHVAITEGSSVGPFALWQYQQAIENSKLTDKEVIAKRREQGRVFLDEITTAVIGSSKPFYANLTRDISEAKQAYLELASTVAEYFNDFVLPKTKVINALDEFSDHIRFITKDTDFAVSTVESIEHASVNASEEMSVIETPVAVPTASNTLANREQALQQLSAVALFFKQHEPQSPLPYLLERAQQLGRLSFAELLNELVDDESARNAAYKLMGFRVSEAE
jgi:type VI secretion system protein ImpA